MKLPKYVFVFLVVFVLAFVSFSYGVTDSYFSVYNKKTNKSSTKYHFGNYKGIKVTITPEKNEFPAGSTATFTVTITNKNKYPVNIEYPTGQQWDMVIYKDGHQIIRWSNGFTWEKSHHSIPLKAGKSISKTLNWTAVNIKGEPLVQGIYKCVGLATCYPKTIISDTVSFRLTPPSVLAKEIIKTQLNQCFEIELPRFANGNELVWDIVYALNDNRISLTKREIKQESIVITFLPKRIGHVEFDLYAYPEFLGKSVALERRSYRIEVE